MELRSGSRIVSLGIPFTHQASEDLQAATGSARNDYEAQKREAVEKTRKYIELLLDAGGDGLGPSRAGRRSTND